MNKTYVIRKNCNQRVKGSSDKINILRAVAQKSPLTLPEAFPASGKNSGVVTAPDVSYKAALKLENGDIYDGEMRENKFNGKGTYVKMNFLD